MELKIEMQNMQKISTYGEYKSLLVEGTLWGMPLSQTSKIQWRRQMERMIDLILIALGYIGLTCIIGYLIHKIDVLTNYKKEKQNDID